MNTPVQEVVVSSSVFGHGNITWPQFCTVVGGKYTKDGKEKRSAGLVNTKVIELSTVLTGIGTNGNHPTVAQLLSYRQGANGKRDWFVLTKLTAGQAAVLIDHLINLPNKNQNGNVQASQAEPWGEPVPAEAHTIVPATQTPELAKLADGRYHLEGSNGYYISVRTSPKNGQQYISWA